MRIECSRALALTSRNDLVQSELGADAEHFAAQARSPSTRRAYATDLKRFSGWCAERGLQVAPCSPENLSNYLAWMATQDFKLATIQRNLAAISVAHQKLHFNSPRRDEVVREIMRGIRRDLGVAQIKKRPILVGDLKCLVEATGEGLKGARDRALVILGFAGGLRRSELVGLNVEDLTFAEEGLEIMIRRSKTDQNGAGVRLGIPFGGHPATCPVRTVKTWVTNGQRERGPLFLPVNRHGGLGKKRLSPKAVASVLKSLAATVGMDPQTIGGHSLRSGLVTSAIRAGKSERLVMAQTRHRSVAVFRGYIRAAEDLFQENAAAGIGL